MRKYKQEPYTVPPWIYNAIQVLRPVERLTVSEWAAKYRVLPDGNAIPGPWSNSVTPYLVEIMDTFSDDMVEEIVFVKPTQVGGTSPMENMLGSLIAPGPGPGYGGLPVGRPGGAHHGKQAGANGEKLQGSG